MRIYKNLRRLLSDQRPLQVYACCIVGRDFLLMLSSQPRNVNSYSQNSLIDYPWRSNNRNNDGRRIIWRSLHHWDMQSLLAHLPHNISIVPCFLGGGSVYLGRPSSLLLCPSAARHNKCSWVLPLVRPLAISLCLLFLRFGPRMRSAMRFVCALHSPESTGTGPQKVVIEENFSKLSIRQIFSAQ